MWFMGLKICMDDEHHRYYKHTRFCKNLRGDPKFLVDLTRNDPIVTDTSLRRLFTEHTPVYVGLKIYSRAQRIVVSKTFTYQNHFLAATFDFITFPPPGLFRGPHLLFYSLAVLALDIISFYNCKPQSQL